MSNEKNLGQYLKKLRNSYNYSQEFVASHLNITRQTYSHYETGRITPPTNSLYNLARLYGISTEKLMERIVTYNINDDFVRKPSTYESTSIQQDDLSSFLEYINAPENTKKFKLLNHNEKFFLYYYDQLDRRNQEDILAFMKIKYLNERRG
ncbi:MAG: helix-turn-helix transcriptional regulator [Lachnospiraceae bacterium]|nr:helix-turn-helix transcriptional regulator [Lachnospiraceae bacterium]